MNILISSYVFSPSIGGIESSSALLATEFARSSHAVKVITQTPESDIEDWPFQVIRQPSIHELFRLVYWCDVCFHNNISLRSAWPVLVLRRPWVITHQTWFAGMAKRLACRMAINVSISEAVARTLPVPSTSIGNPYRDETFRNLPEISRDRDLVFLGRLVSDKGVDLLLLALANLRDRGLFARLMIIGSGPEEPTLRNLAEQLAIDEQVQFVGPQSGEMLVQLLNRHRIMVVPSRWEEPFGIVALEGIACGCIVVGSAGGGLAEAIGPCGVTFPNGDHAALAQRIRRLLGSESEIERLRTFAPAHLKRFSACAVANTYLSIFHRVCL